MDAEISENLFASYLESRALSFERNFCVCGSKNIDFKVVAQSVIALCDVKEVHDSRVGPQGEIDAYTHIREDLKDLRRKFGGTKPTFPVVLVTMNFSSKFFTAHTVSRAMYGDIGAQFSGNERGEIHHLPRGNASMTTKTNTSISGILVYDCAAGNHVYFSNEFAEIKLPKNYFPGATEYELKRSAGEADLVQLSNLMFWECDENKKP